MIENQTTQENRQIVLVVDDGPENLAVIGELLRPSYAIQVANNGERALQLANGEARPDLILLDVMMPGMDGKRSRARPTRHKSRSFFSPPAATRKIS